MVNGAVGPPLAAGKINKQKHTTTKGIPPRVQRARASPPTLAFVASLFFYFPLSVCVALSCVNVRVRVLSSLWFVTCRRMVCYGTGRLPSVVPSVLLSLSVSSPNGSISFLSLSVPPWPKMLLLLPPPQKRNPDQKPTFICLPGGGGCCLLWEVNAIECEM